MHIERIRFDRVFDAQPRGGAFSFASAGKTVYGVALPGRRIPREGATLALVLAQAGNWQSVLGWRDLGTQETAVAGSTLGIVVDSLDPLCYLTPFLIAGGFLLAGVAGALGGLTVAGAGVAWLAARGLQRRRRVRAALAAVV